MLNKKIVVFALALLTAGCIPIYKPQDISKTVTLVADNQNMNLRICQNSKWYRLEREQDGTYKIPYGQSLSLGNFFFQSDGYYDVSCFAAVKFIPRQNGKYYMNFLLKGKLCGVEVLRYTNKNKLGLMPEPTVSYKDVCLSR